MPDIVLEAGNMAVNPAHNDPDYIDDGLQLLTTHHNFTRDRPLTTFGDTSAAAAIAARMAAALWAKYPAFTPETVRALMVHAADWTPAMLARFTGADGALNYEALLRCFGYGVPRFWAAHVERGQLPHADRPRRHSTLLQGERNRQNTGDAPSAERSPEGLTIDAIVETAGVAKGTFYYHFQSIEELVAAAGAKLADSFDELLTPSRLEVPDPVKRIAFAFTKFLEKALDEPVWGRLVVRSVQVPGAIRRARENLKADLAEAIDQGRLAIQDVELAADIVMGIWVQVTRGSLERRASPELPAKRATPCCERLA